MVMQVHKSARHTTNRHMFHKFDVGFIQQRCKYAYRVVVITLFLALFSLQILWAEAIAPSPYPGHALAPSLVDSLAATSAREKYTRQDVATGRDSDVQKCLDNQRGTKGKAYSTWVKNFHFKYRGTLFNDDDFHRDSWPLAKKLMALKKGTSNLVHARLSVIYSTSTHGRTRYIRKVVPSHSNKCYTSGEASQTLGQTDCLGWGDVFDAVGEAKYLAFLNDGLGTNFQSRQDFADEARKYAHSEQALLGGLFLDAEACETAMDSQDCLLYQDAVGGGWRDELCNIELFIVDVFSFPNSVCPYCDTGFSVSRFFDKYKQALTTFCAAQNPPLQARVRKLVVLTSSLKKYSGGYHHISCAGVNYGGIVTRLMEDSDPVTLHLLPLDDMFKTTPSNNKRTGKTFKIVPIDGPRSGQQVKAGAKNTRKPRALPRTTKTGIPVFNKGRIDLKNLFNGPLPTSVHGKCKAKVKIPNPTCDAYKH